MVRQRKDNQEGADAFDDATSRRLPLVSRMAAIDRILVQDANRLMAELFKAAVY